MALAARLDEIDKRIFVIIGDGESREGQVWEAADFIVDHKLNNVCAVFSCNGHGQAAPVSPQQSAEAIAAKAAAYGWHVLDVDGHDPGRLSEAFDQMGASGKPTAVVARTVKGWGVASMLGKNFHGKPLPAGDLEQAIGELEETTAGLEVVADGAWLPKAPPACPPVTPIRMINLPPFEQAMTLAGLDSALGKKQIATRRAYGAALLALGDPVFPRSGEAAPPSPPAEGVYVTQVVHGSNADAHGLVCGVGFGVLLAVPSRLA